MHSTSEGRRNATTRPTMAAVACLAVLASACGASSSPAEADAPFEIPFERYVLSNGLEVVLHQDASDPIVAVATIVHVGSSREQVGRTGFAHLFEHMSFNDSENVPRGANRQMIPELGGLRNGGTSADMTIYYEVVPTDAFEKILWIDSDRLGYMINTVTQAALEREKQVVKNEKRQNYDNVPYGHTRTVQQAHLYPEDHPYHWTTIGALEDLQNATLADVQQFYARFYGPDNATLVIAGDIDLDETRRLVDYWFGEIPRGPDVESPTPRPAALARSRSLVWEDNFATLPELQMVFPTVEQFHGDAYALDTLAELLAGSRVAPLYQTVVEEGRLAPSVSAAHETGELAGTLTVRVRGNVGTDLDTVQAALDAGFARFEAAGVPDDELARIKAQGEYDLYAGMQDVLNKAFQLAQFNEFTRDPGYISTVATRMRNVTAADVMRVYRRYIQGRPSVTTSFVPKGEPQLALAGAVAATVFEEPIVVGAESDVSQGEEAAFARTDTVADRSEPPLGPAPLLKAPTVWTARLDNGLEVLGTEQRELPLVAFDLSIRGGSVLDPTGKAGAAALLSSMMTEGTTSRTPDELERAFGLLGARVSVTAGAEEIRVSGSTLARNFGSTLALVEELLLEPRWDESEYARLRRELDTRLTGREADAVAISDQVFARLIYGEDHAFGTPTLGTRETVAGLTLDDLKAYFAANISPSVSAFHVAGAVDQAGVLAALAGLAARWEATDVVIPAQPTPPSVAGRTIYFVDMPGAAQSVLRAGRLALAAGDPDAEALGWANMRLGGSSSGRLFQLLRIEKGYTYGAQSGVQDRLEIAPFQALTSVRANVTKESLELLREQLRTYGPTFTDRDVELTKNQIIKGNTRAYESLAAKLSLLREMSRLGLGPDFIERNQEALLAMTREDSRRLIETYLDERGMIYVVVGDAATQMGRLATLGYGAPIPLDIYGRPVTTGAGAGPSATR